MNARKFLTLLALCAATIFTSGCYTGRRTVTLNPGPFPKSVAKREGNLAVEIRDGRSDTNGLGKLGGRIGNNPIVVIDGKLQDKLTDIVGDMLEQEGYRIIADAPAVLEGEVREFRVHGDGWTQGASERIRFRLRTKTGGVVWERTFKGEDGGMDMVDSFAEKSMNVALTRLLTDASEDFTSESFYQCVQKAAAK
jgi:uncharacterized lipoprotein YajG